MKTNIYILLLFCFTLTAFSQNNLINQKDSIGKKHGKWLVYWDSNWKEVKDSSQSVYHRYTVYDHGENIYPMGSCGAKSWKLESDNKPASKLSLQESASIISILPNPRKFNAKNPSGYIAGRQSEIKSLYFSLDGTHYLRELYVKSESSLYDFRKYK